MTSTTSKHCVSSALDFDAGPPRDTSLIDAQDEILRAPINLPQDIDDLTIKWYIPPSRQLLDPVQVFVEATLQIVYKNGTVVPEAKRVAMCTVFAAVCFCCVIAFTICVEIQITCVAKNHKTITNTTGFCIDYPFSLSDIAVQDICSDSTYPAYILTVDYDTQAEFFVAVGVLSLLFALVVFLFYVRYWNKYNYTTYFPFPDLLITFTLASFWFASSCCWASAVDSLSQYADYQSILATIKKLMSCQGKDNSCSLTPGYWSYGTLVFSVVLGFINTIIWYWNSFLLFRNLKYIKMTEQSRLDNITASVDYPGHGAENTAVIGNSQRSHGGPNYGSSSQDNNPIF